MRFSVLANPSPAALFVAGLTHPPRFATRRMADQSWLRELPELRLDLYRPVDAPPPRPAVVVIHGGSFRRQSRLQLAWHAERLAEQGFVTIAIDYRLGPAGRYPAAQEDCRQAVRWLRERADELEVDPARIGALGTSAGGHLAAHLGLRGTSREARVAATVAFYGIHDLTRLEGEAYGLCRDYLGAEQADDPELWRAASPITWVDADSAPMLLLHDPGDPLVPYRQSVAMAEALMSAGRPVELLPVPDGLHRFAYEPGGIHLHQVWPTVVHWLQRQLGQSP